MCSGRCYVNQQVAEAIGQQQSQEEVPATPIVDWSEQYQPFLLSSLVLREPSLELGSASIPYLEQHYAFLFRPFVFEPPC